MDSQVRQIKAHLNRGLTITPMEALQSYGCFRLAARIKDLRDDGFPVKTVIVETANGKRIAKYIKG